MWSGWVTRADLLPSVRYMLYWIIQLKYDSQTLMKAFKINRFYFPSSESYKRSLMRKSDLTKIFLSPSPSTLAMSPKGD